MTRLSVVGNNQGGTAMGKSNFRIASIICALLLVCGSVFAQPGSIVTQTKNNALIDASKVNELGVVNKTSANQVLNNLVGTWKFEYSLSEDLGGYAAGTPVIATVTYRRDFSTGGLFGFAETLTLSGASVSNGTYFINWNDTTSMLESHGRFVAGEVVAIFDEYLDAIKGDTYCWIGQRTQDGVASPNVLIERCIRNNSFNVVVNELSASGNPLAQVWNVSGVRVNMLKECLGPFVTLASEWQSESYTDAGDRIRIEHNGYWAADEACLVVEVKKFTNDTISDNTIQTFYYDTEMHRIAFTEVGANGLVCTGYISPTTERNGTPCQLRVLDSAFGNGAKVSTINKMFLVDSKTIKIDFEWAWWEGSDITSENDVVDFEQRFVLKRVPASNRAIPRPASF